MTKAAYDREQELKRHIQKLEEELADVKEMLEDLQASQHLELAYGDRIPMHIKDYWQKVPAIPAQKRWK